MISRADISTFDSAADYWAAVGQEERRVRRLIRGVVLCLQPIAQDDIAKRCEKYYGLDVETVAERLGDMLAVGAIEQAGQDDYGFPAYSIVKGFVEPIPEPEEKPCSKKRAKRS